MEINIIKILILRQIHTIVIIINLDINQPMLLKHTTPLHNINKIIINNIQNKLMEAIPHIIQM